MPSTKFHSAIDHNITSSVALRTQSEDTYLIEDICDYPTVFLVLFAERRRRLEYSSEVRLLCANERAHDVLRRIARHQTPKSFRWHALTSVPRVLEIQLRSDADPTRHCGESFVRGRQEKTFRTWRRLLCDTDIRLAVDNREVNDFQCPCNK